MTNFSHMLNDRTWVERSQAADDLTPQFSFRLCRTIHVPHPDSGQARSGAYNPFVSLPELGARDPLRPSAREVLGQEAKLAARYRELTEMTGKRPAA